MAFRFLPVLFLAGLATASAMEAQLAANLRPRSPFAERAAAAEKARPAREAFATARSGRVSGARVNVRSGPDTGFDIVVTLQGGDWLAVTAQIGEWLEIDWPETAPAWISREYVEPNGRLSGDRVRIRAHGHLKSVVLGEARKGERVEIVSASGAWYRIKAPEGARAYIHANYAVLDAAPAEAPQAAPSVAAGSEAPTAKSPERPEAPRPQHEDAVRDDLAGIDPADYAVPAIFQKAEAAAAPVKADDPSPTVPIEPAFVAMTYAPPPEDAWTRAFNRAERFAHADPASLPLEAVPDPDWFVRPAPAMPAEPRLPSAEEMSDDERRFGYLLPPPKDVVRGR